MEARQTVTCEDCKNQLQELVDNEVPPGEKAALEAHLQGCPECARLHRQLARFTTTVVKLVHPLQPAQDFSSKVLGKFTESKPGLQALPPQAPSAARTVGVPWPFAVAIGVAVLAGIILLAWPAGGPPLARLVRGTECARVLVYSDGAWRAEGERKTVRGGERIEALPLAGALVELDFSPVLPAHLLLQAPGQAHLERQPDAVVLRPLPENPGRYFIRTSRATDPGAVKAIRLVLGKARVELQCNEENSAVVTCGDKGELLVAVKTGSAILSNLTDQQPLAQGFSRAVPQAGSCTLPVQVPEGTFDWTQK